MAGIQNIKNLGNVIKLGAEQIAKAIQKDGFQPVDILSPLSSVEFNNALSPVLAGYKDIIAEAADLGPMEIFEIVKGIYVGYTEIKDDLKAAHDKLSPPA